MVLPAFSFLPPMDFTFQFSSGCLVESLQSPARKEKLNHTDYLSGVEECWDCDQEKAARPGNEHIIPLYNSKVVYIYIYLYIFI